MLKDLRLCIVDNVSMEPWRGVGGAFIVCQLLSSFTHPFNQVDIAVVVELLSIFMKDLRLRIWTWLESIVLVKLAYYAPSTAQNLRNYAPGIKIMPLDF